MKNDTYSMALQSYMRADEAAAARDALSRAKSIAGKELNENYLVFWKEDLSPHIVFSKIKLMQERYEVACQDLARQVHSASIFRRIAFRALCNHRRMFRQNGFDEYVADAYPASVMYPFEAVERQESDKVILFYEGE